MSGIDYTDPSHLVNEYNRLGTPFIFSPLVFPWYSVWILDYFLLILFNKTKKPYNTTKTSKKSYNTTKITIDIWYFSTSVLHDVLSSGLDLRLSLALKLCFKMFWISKWLTRREYLLSWEIEIAYLLEMSCHIA